jgi:hypothetical protein
MLIVKVFVTVTESLLTKMVCHIAIGARTEASEAYPEVNIGE